MKLSAAHSRWLPRVPPTAGAFRPWLADRGSLTQRVKDRCTAFRVEPLCQQFARVSLDETALIGLGRFELALTREVLLYCAETPVVFAHSVVDRAGLRGPWRWLVGLGARPLGAALFADPRVERSPLAFRALHAHHLLFRRAASMLPMCPDVLWARRSLFVREGVPLLVTEVFLPGVLGLRR